MNQRYIHYTHTYAYGREREKERERGITRSIGTDEETTRSGRDVKGEINE